MLGNLFHNKAASAGSGICVNLLLVSFRNILIQTCGMI